MIRYWSYVRDCCWNSKPKRFSRTPRSMILLVLDYLVGRIYTLSSSLNCLSLLAIFSRYKPYRSLPTIQILHVKLLKDGAARDTCLVTMLVSFVSSLRFHSLSLLNFRIWHLWCPIPPFSGKVHTFPIFGVPWAVGTWTLFSQAALISRDHQVLKMITTYPQLPQSFNSRSLATRHWVKWLTSRRVFQSGLRPTAWHVDSFKNVFCWICSAHSVRPTDPFCVLDPFLLMSLSNFRVLSFCSGNLMEV